MSDEVYAVSDKEYTINQALTEACKAARIDGLLYKGGKQCIRALKTGNAVLVILAKDQEQRISSIVSHFASQAKVPVIFVEDKQELARIVGLEKISSEGKTRTAKCGVVVIEKFNVQTKATQCIENELVKA